MLLKSVVPNRCPVSPMYDLSQPMQGMSYTTSLVSVLSFLSFGWTRIFLRVFVGRIAVATLCFRKTLFNFSATPSTYGITTMPLEGVALFS